MGIWSDDHISGLRKIVDTIHLNGAKAGIQINHAGRKAKVDEPVGPSAINYGGDYKNPKEMTKKDIKDTVIAFRDAARRAAIYCYWW